ncbi:hypothetical protein HNY73_001279 [Argiope bruennichi]|uniref:Uncharacterized protein n=1 Tax=Argiope bruennichi TaxID=94029 RepID=A0A8T0G0T1_ARGBR|nr:hypothetical protein HNY73_001279 [Argiope bruennichi]
MFSSNSELYEVPYPDRRHSNSLTYTSSLSETLKFSPYDDSWDSRASRESTKDDRHTIDRTEISFQPERDRKGLISREEKKGKSGTLDWVETPYPVESKRREWCHHPPPVTPKQFEMWKKKKDKHGDDTSCSEVDEGKLDHLRQKDEDSEVPVPLTPAHLLMGRRVNSLPPARLTIDTNLNNRKMIPVAWVGKTRDCRPSRPGRIPPSQFYQRLDFNLKLFMDFSSSSVLDLLGNVSIWMCLDILRDIKSSVTSCDRVTVL